MKRFRLIVIALISLLLFAIAGTVYCVLLGQWHTTAYAAGRTNEVKIYAFSDELNEEKAEDADVSAASDGTDKEGENAETKENADTEGSAEGEESAAPEGDGDEAADSGASHTLVEAGSLTRGAEVIRYRQSVTQDGITYHRIKVGDTGKTSEEGVEDGAEESAEDGAEESAEEGTVTGKVDLYMAEESLADSLEQTVLETEVYVRTPATIYKEAGSPDIASFAPKGTHLQITGHDRLLDNGYINMYKVAYTGADGSTAEGYVYGKYMTDTQESADAPYNEHGEYDKARKDGFRFELYGGEAEDLDFYPYERTAIAGNEFCRHARAMYINAAAAVHPDEYIKLIRESGCNAVVIDLKDGPLTYKSEVAEELSPASYKAAYFSEEELKKGVDAYREAGVYLIGRIVTFNDPYYAQDHPEDCIKYNGNAGWPSAFSRNVWEYNVKLAQEAVEKFGFNEIQFDYVRFPESTYEMSKSGKADFRNTYGESKAQAVQNFCFYAADQLRESGAYISIDVFGESAYSYVTAYGQYWTAISNIADAISAMPYTDHFSGTRPWEDPYGSVRRWAKRAAKQQKRLETPAAARTWITGYNTPHWAPNVDYNEERMKEQIKALEDSGLDGGFIPWNVLSDLGKYREYKGIWAE